MKFGSRVSLFLGLGITVVLAMFSAAGATLTFSNTDLLLINDSLAPPTKASPYPSSLMVTGLTGQFVGKLTVGLHGFTHAYPSDVTMLLVAPSGQQAIAMSEVGGQQQFSVTNLELTFDDDATQWLSPYTPLTSGTFAPANGYLLFDHTTLPYDLPPPAPAANSNAVSSFTVFKNTDPNGMWNLFVVDDVGDNAGVIGHGWSLNLTTGIPLQLAVSQHAVIASWPATIAGCTLQVTTNPMGSALWTNLATPQFSSSGRFLVTNSILPHAAFYRLVH